MKDPVNQLGADHGEAVSSVGLTERLLRRHSEPIGLVDVNHADSFYNRTAGWVARRFELLDRWKTRYDIEDTSRTGGKFVFAAPSVQSSPVVSSEAPLARSNFQPAASVPSPARSEQYRVRRHVASPISAPVATNSTGGQDNPELRAGDAGATGNNLVDVTGNDLKTTTRGLAERNESRGVETPTIRGETRQPMTRLIARKNISRSPDYAKGLSTTEVATGTSQASGVNASSSLPPHVTQPAMGATASVALAQSPLPKSDLSQASAPRALSLVAARTNDISREIKSSEVTPTLVEEFSTPPAKTESPAVLPLRNSNSSPLRVQRRPAPGSEPLVQQTDSSPPHVQRQPSPVGERLGRQTDSSPLHVHQQPSSATEALGQDADSLPLRVQRQSARGSEQLGGRTDSLPLHVQRQPSSATEAVRRRKNSSALRDAPEPGADQTSKANETQKHFAAPQRLSSSEVHVASLSTPTPSLVLRKAAESWPTSDGLSAGSARNANVTLPLAVNRSAQPADSVVARQTEEGTPAGSSQAEPVPRDESGPASSGTAQASSIDLDQLAEQVGKVLSRQLAVERERRGIKGWD